MRRLHDPIQHLQTALLRKNRMEQVDVLEAIRDAKGASDGTIHTAPDLLVRRLLC